MRILFCVIGQKRTSKSGANTRKYYIFHFISYKHVHLFIYLTPIQLWFLFLSLATSLIWVFTYRISVLCSCPQEKNADVSSFSDSIPTNCEHYEQMAISFSPCNPRVKTYTAHMRWLFFCLFIFSFVFADDRYRQLIFVFLSIVIPISERESTHSQWKGGRERERTEKLRNKVMRLETRETVLDSTQQSVTHRSYTNQPTSSQHDSHV